MSRAQLRDEAFVASIQERAFRWDTSQVVEASILLTQVGGTLGTPVFTWEGSFDRTTWVTVVAVVIGTRIDWTEVDFPHNRIRVSTAGGTGLLLTIDVWQRRRNF